MTASSKYRYSVYGVRVTSDLPLEFPVARATETPLADVEFVECADADFPGPPRARDANGDNWFACRSSADGSIYVRWADLYEFYIDKDGARVVCHQLARGSRGVLQNFLFGQALSFALVRQGLEQLHAAVLAVDDMAIGFLGDCTYGKSTLAAAFVRAGYRLVTDDVLMIDWRASGPIALPGSGRIKLEPSSAFALLSNSTHGVLLHPDATKRSFPIAADRLQRTGLRLAHLFVLPSPEERGRIKGMEIRPLSRATMLRELLKSSFNVQLFDRARIERQFAFAAQAASNISGSALRYPYGLHHLPAVREGVIDYIHQTCGNRTSAVT